MAGLWRPAASMVLLLVDAQASLGAAGAQPHLRRPARVPTTLEPRPRAVTAVGYDWRGSSLAEAASIEKWGTLLQLETVRSEPKERDAEEEKRERHKKKHELETKRSRGEGVKDEAAKKEDGGADVDFEGEEDTLPAEGEEGGQEEEGEDGDVLTHDGHEGEEGEEEEEEEGEDEMEFTPVDVDAACMLLGGVTSVTLLFQLVNFDDDDVRRYAWKVVSNTISIFMAVLFFQGNNHILTKFLVDRLGLSPLMFVLVQYVHCFFYISLMLLAVAFTVGVICESKVIDLDVEAWTIADAMLYDFGAEVDEKEVRAVKRGETNAKKSIFVDKWGLEVAVMKKPLEYEKRNRRSQAWSTLLAHMAGFAAIAAGGGLQRTTFFRKNPLFCLIPVAITTAMLLVVFQLSGVIRAQMKAQAARANRKGRRAGIVHARVSEAEDDILSLSLSYLTTQAIRYAITGKLPNEEGLEPLNYEFDWAQVRTLWLAGLGFLLLSPALTRLRSSLAHTGGAEALVSEGEEESDSAFERFVDVFANACAMASAWCFFFGARWAWILQPLCNLHVLSIDGRIVLAMCLSIVCLFAVLLLDKLDDALRESQDHGAFATKAIARIVVAISLLVGFAWEHSFDGAVTAVAALNRSHPETTKFTIGVIVFVVLLRPWRRYILNRSMQLEDLKASRDKASQNLYGTSSRSRSRAETAQDEAPLLDHSSRRSSFPGCC